MKMAQRELPKIGEIVVFYNESKGFSDAKTYPAMVMGKSKNSTCLNLKVFELHQDTTDIVDVPYSNFLENAHWSFMGTMTENRHERFIRKVGANVLHDLTNFRGKLEEFPKEDGDRENYPIGIQYVHTVYLDRYRSTAGITPNLSGIYEGQIEVVSTVKGLQQRFHGFDMPYDEEVYLQPEDKILSWQYSKNYIGTLRLLAKNKLQEVEAAPF